MVNHSKPSIFLGSMLRHWSWPSPCRTRKNQICLQQMTIWPRWRKRRQFQPSKDHWRPTCETQVVGLWRFNVDDLWWFMMVYDGLWWFMMVYDTSDYDLCLDHMTMFKFTNGQWLLIWSVPRTGGGALRQEEPLTMAGQWDDFHCKGLDSCERSWKLNRYTQNYSKIEKRSRLQEILELAISFYIIPK